MTPNSRDTSSLRTVLANTGLFLHSYYYAGKADISKGYWSPSRKLGVTLHFTEISNNNSKKQ